MRQDVPSTEATDDLRCAVGILNEKPLHAALKDWYSKPGDRHEVLVDGYVVDIVRGDHLIEIQTRNFAAISRKLRALAARYRVRLVYPVPREKWIVKVGQDGETPLGRRKSPRRGTFEDVFRELVSFPELLADPDFSLDVLLIQEDEIRRYDGSRGWRRRGWVVCERRLLDVVGRQLLTSPADAGVFLPPELEEPFTTADLARAIAKPRRLAQRMAYCLRKMGAIVQQGKRGNALLYVRADVLTSVSAA
jgi:hypothetical protein